MTRLTQLLWLVEIGDINPNTAERWRNGKLVDYERKLFEEAGLPLCKADAEHQARLERSDEPTGRIGVPGAKRG